MGRLSDVLRIAEDSGLIFYCPGCQTHHMVKTGTGSGPRWRWDGDVDHPTIEPSVKVIYEHWVPPYEFGQPKPEKQEKVTEVCHFFVKEGLLRFLGDCTHHLKNQTVPMMKLPE